LAKEIGCEKILVRIGRASNTFNQIIQFLYSTISRKGIKNDKLVAEIIEGNDVNIEHTEASIVRGKMVRIGQGCVIKKVEYSESISIASDAEVKEMVKL
jgi:acetyltransferase-like isoleucine patch superfamily enzyme